MIAEFNKKNIPHFIQPQKKKKKKKKKMKIFLRESLPFLKMDTIVIERENVTKFPHVLIEENLSWKST